MGGSTEWQVPYWLGLGRAHLPASQSLRGRSWIRIQVGVPPSPCCFCWASDPCVTLPWGEVVHPSESSKGAPGPASAPPTWLRRWDHGRSGNIYLQGQGIKRKEVKTRVYLALFGEKEFPPLNWKNICFLLSQRVSPFFTILLAFVI